MLSYCLFAAVLSYFNFRLIKSGKKIYHALNGILHITAAGIAFYLYDWQHSVALLCLVRVIFDTTLNIFRSLGLGYLSPSPASIVDKIEVKAVELLATFVYWKRKYISDDDIEMVAIVLRVVILLAGIFLLIPF